MSLSRRLLLQLAALLPGRLFAQSIGGGSGISNAVASGSGFNGGRMQIQPSLGNAGDFSFMNLMKLGGGWTLIDNSGIPDPSTLDVNGYPTALTGAVGCKQRISAVPNTQRSGNLVIGWIGNGTVFQNSSLISGSLTGLNGRAVIASTSDGQIDIGISAIGSPPISDLWVVHVDDEVSYLAQKALGIEPLGVQFRSQMGRARCGVWRTLNSQNANLSNMTTWSTRRSQNHYTYSGFASEWRASLYIGAAAGTNDYTATYGSGGPTDKETIHLKFTNTSTFTAATVTVTGSNGNPINVQWTSHGFAGNEPIAIDNSGSALPNPLNGGMSLYVKTVVDANNFTVSATPGGATINGVATTSTSQLAIRACTFNKNSTGAVQIRNAQGGPLTGNDVPNAHYQGSAQLTYGTMVYDAAFNCWILFGGSFNARTGLTNGIPFEIILQMCTTLGMHTYTVDTYLSAEPRTDLVTQWALYLKANAPSWMIPRFETPNESWNPSFVVNRFAANRAQLYWQERAAFPYNWTGIVGSTLGQALNAAFGGAVGSRYQAITGCQAVQFNTVGGANSNDPRMTSDLYVNQAATGLPQAGYTKSAASGWLTHAALAGYIAPTEYQTAQEVTDAAAYDAAAGNPATQYSIAQAYVDTLAGAADGNFNLAQLAIVYGNMFTWTQKFTNSAGNKIKMTQYEGGPGWTYSANGTSQLDRLRAAAKYTANLQTYVTTNLSNFISAGGEFPAQFQLSTGPLTAPNIDSDVWGALANMYTLSSPGLPGAPFPAVGTDPPTWKAIIAFNN